MPALENLHKLQQKGKMGEDPCVGTTIEFMQQSMVSCGLASLIIMQSLSMECCELTRARALSATWLKGGLAIVDVVVINDVDIAAIVSNSCWRPGHIEAGRRCALVSLLAQRVYWWGTLCTVQSSVAPDFAP